MAQILPNLLILWTLVLIRIMWFKVDQKIRDEVTGFTIYSKSPNSKKLNFGYWKDKSSLQSLLIIHSPVYNCPIQIGIVTARLPNFITIKNAVQSESIVSNQSINERAYTTKTGAFHHRQKFLAWNDVFVFHSRCAIWGDNKAIFKKQKCFKNSVCLL